MISQIVDRCHVSDSNLSVIRYFRSRLVKGSWRKLSRNQRRVMLRSVIDCHLLNRDLYRSVMLGTL